MSKKLLPRLRFPEFRDSGEWVEKRLGDVSQLIEKKAGNGKFILMSVTAGVGLITQKEKFGREIAGNAYKNYYVIKKGDFAYNKSATKQFPEGYIAMLTEHEEAALPNSIFTCFRITDSNSFPKYFNHLFHKNYHGTWLRKFIAIGARAHGSLNVDINNLLEMPVPIPTLPEQQRIADCLSSLDDLITAEAEKLTATKAHKKALMQQLFPSNGETVPRLRFPEFRDSGEWVEKRLGEIAEIVTGNTPSTTNPQYYGGNKIFVSPADISDLRYLSSTKTTLTEAGFKETRPVKVNSILFVCIGSTIGKIAQNKVECATNQQINSVVPFNGYSNDFIYSVLELNANKIASIAGKHAVPIINKTAFSNTILLMPSFPEQQRIADCLSSLDSLIAAQGQKIEKLKEHKKALMQGLFPSHEEENV